MEDYLYSFSQNCASFVVRVCPSPGKYIPALEDSRYCTQYTPTWPLSHILLFKTAPLHSTIYENVQGKKKLYATIVYINGIDLFDTTTIALYNLCDEKHFCFFIQNAGSYHAKKCYHGRIMLVHKLQTRKNISYRKWTT